MFGSLLNGDGKGKFGGPECRGNWKFTLEEAPAPNEAIPVVAETEPQEKLQVQATFTADDVPPVIEAPGNLQTENSVVALRGQVSDSSTIVEFTINGTAAQINADGSFSLKRGVTIGDSEIVIAALDEWGNESIKNIRVTRSAPLMRGDDATPPAAESEIATRGQQSNDQQQPHIKLTPKLVTDNSHVEIAGRI